MENCEKAYSRPCLLEQHIRSHKDERPYLCNVPGCNKAFLRDSHLKTHLLSHSVEKPLYCSFCGKGFNTNQHLNRHERTHVPSVRCTYQGCDAAFRRASQLRKHVSEFHTFRKEHVCPHCPREFDLRSRLEAHIRKAHSTVPVYQCGNEDCSENFSSWQDLQAHIKACHKSITCYCGLKFTSETALTEHMKSCHSQSTSGGAISSGSNPSNIFQDHYTQDWHCRESQCLALATSQFRDKDTLIYHYQQFHGFVPESLQVQVLTPASTIEGLPPLSSLGNSVENHSSHQSQPQGQPYLAFQSYHLQQSQSQQQLPKRREPLASTSTLIERITGSGYDINRRIMCPIPDCHYRFAREYDLRRHVKAKHPHILTDSGRLTIDYISIPAVTPHSEMSPASSSPSPASFTTNIKQETLDDSSFDNHTTLPPLPTFSQPLSGIPNSSNQHNTHHHINISNTQSTIQQNNNTQGTSTTPLSVASNPSTTSSGTLEGLSHSQSAFDAFLSNDILQSGSHMNHLQLHLSNELLNDNSSQYQNITRSGNSSLTHQQHQTTIKTPTSSYSTQLLQQQQTGSIQVSQSQASALRNVHSVSANTPNSTSSQSSSLQPSRSHTPIYTPQSHIYPVQGTSSNSPQQTYGSRHNSPQSINQSLTNTSHGQSLVTVASKSFSLTERGTSPRQATIGSGSSQEIDPMILNGSV